MNIHKGVCATLLLLAAAAGVVAVALTRSAPSDDLPDEGTAVSEGREEWLSPADQSLHTVETLTLGNTAANAAENLNGAELHHKKIDDIYLYEMVPSHAKTCPILFMIHGQGSRKEEFLHDMYTYAEAGYICVALDICGAGERTSDEMMMSIQATVTTGEDLNTLIEYYRTQPYADAEAVAIFGLSQGGSIAYWYAAYGMYPLSAIVVGCTTVDFNDYLETSAIVNGKTQPGFWSDEELKAYVSRNNPADNLAAFNKLPILSGHGTDDPLVPVKRDEELERYLLSVGNTEAYFYYYDQVGHNVPEQFIQKILPFLNRTVGGKDAK